MGKETVSEIGDRIAGKRAPFRLQDFLSVQPCGGRICPHGHPSLGFCRVNSGAAYWLTTPNLRPGQACSSGGLRFVQLRRQKGEDRASIRLQPPSPCMFGTAAFCR
jgi:hypothetical protein